MSTRFRHPASGERERCAARGLQVAASWPEAPSTEKKKEDIVFLNPAVIKHALFIHTAFYIRAGRYTMAVNMLTSFLGNFTAVCLPLVCLRDRRFQSPGVQLHKHSPGRFGDFLPNDT